MGRNDNRRNKDKKPGETPKTPIQKKIASYELALRSSTDPVEKACIKYKIEILNIIDRHKAFNNSTRKNFHKQQNILAKKLKLVKSHDGASITTADSVVKQHLNDGFFYKQLKLINTPRAEDYTYETTPLLMVSHLNEEALQKKLDLVDNKIQALQALNNVSTSTNNNKTLLALETLRLGILVQMKDSDQNIEEYINNTRPVAEFAAKASTIGLSSLDQDQDLGDISNFKNTNASDILTEFNNTLEAQKAKLEAQNNKPISTTAGRYAYGGGGTETATTSQNNPYHLIEDIEPDGTDRSSTPAYNDSAVSQETSEIATNTPPPPLGFDTLRMPKFDRIAYMKEAIEAYRNANITSKTSATDLENLYKKFEKVLIGVNLSRKESEVQESTTTLNNYKQALTALTNMRKAHSKTATQTSETDSSSNVPSSDSPYGVAVKINTTTTPTHGLVDGVAQGSAPNSNAPQNAIYISALPTVNAQYNTVTQKPLVDSTSNYKPATIVTGSKEVTRSTTIDDQSGYAQMSSNIPATPIIHNAGGRPAPQSNTDLSAKQTQENAVSVTASPSSNYQATALMQPPIQPRANSTIAVVSNHSNVQPTSLSQTPAQPATPSPAPTVTATAEKSKLEKAFDRSAISEIPELLNKENVNTPFSDGDTPLFRLVRNFHLMTLNSKSAVIYNQELEAIAEKLLELGADYNSYNKAGVSPYMLALNRNRVYVLTKIKDKMGTDKNFLAQEQEHDQLVMKNSNDLDQRLKNYNGLPNAQKDSVRAKEILSIVVDDNFLLPPLSFNQENNERIRNLRDKYLTAYENAHKTAQPTPASSPVETAVANPPVASATQTANLPSKNTAETTPSSTSPVAPVSTAVLLPQNPLNSAPPFVEEASDQYMALPDTQLEQNNPNATREQYAKFPVFEKDGSSTPAPTSATSTTPQLRPSLALPTRIKTPQENLAYIKEKLVKHDQTMLESQPASFYNIALMQFPEITSNQIPKNSTDLTADEQPTAYLEKYNAIRTDLMARFKTAAATAAASLATTQPPASIPNTTTTPVDSDLASLNEILQANDSARLEEFFNQKQDFIINQILIDSNGKSTTILDQAIIAEKDQKILDILIANKAVTIGVANPYTSAGTLSSSATVEGESATVEGESYTAPSVNNLGRPAPLVVPIPTTTDDPRSTNATPSSSPAAVIAAGPATTAMLNTETYKTALLANKTTDSKNNELHTRILAGNNNFDLIGYLSQEYKKAYPTETVNYVNQDFVKYCANFVNQQNSDGYTPLHLAIIMGADKFTADILNIKDCDPNIQDKDGNTFFHYYVASTDQKTFSDIVYKTVKDRNRNLKNNAQNTPLELYAHYHPVHLISPEQQLTLDKSLLRDCNTSSDNLTKISDLLSLGANPAYTDGTTSPLILAARNGNVTLALKLIVKAPVILETDGIPALREAMLGEKEKFVDFLLEKVEIKERLTTKGSDGQTPLHAAVIRNAIVNVDKLIKAGADINALNAAGKTPLDLALVSESPIKEIVQLFLSDPNSNLTPEILAKAQEAVKPKAPSGALPSAAGASIPASTNLKNAAEKVVNAIGTGAAIAVGSVVVAGEMVKKFGGEFTDSSLVMLDRVKHTVEEARKPEDNNKKLRTAVTKGDAAAVKQLLSDGANGLQTVSFGNPKLSQRKTLLYIAAEKGDIATVRALKNGGVKDTDTNIISVKKGNHSISIRSTALEIAAKNGNYYMMEALDGIKDDNYNALKLEAEANLTAALTNKDAKLLETELKKGATLSPEQFLALVKAPQSTPKMVELALKYDPELMNAKTPNRSNALHIAAGTGRKEMIEQLIKSGFKIDDVNNLGDTPLHVAYRNLFKSKIGSDVLSILSNNNVVGNKNHANQLPEKVLDIAYTPQELDPTMPSPPLAFPPAGAGTNVGMSADGKYSYKYPTAIKFPTEFYKFIQVDKDAKRLTALAKNDETTVGGNTTMSFLDKDGSGVVYHIVEPVAPNTLRTIKFEIKGNFNGVIEPQYLGRDADGNPVYSKGFDVERGAAKELNLSGEGKVKLTGTPTPKFTEIGDVGDEVISDKKTPPPLPPKKHNINPTLAASVKPQDKERLSENAEIREARTETQNSLNSAGDAKKTPPALPPKKKPGLEINH